MCVLLLWLIINGIDFFSHYEKILSANEQETCRAKILGVGLAGDRNIGIPPRLQPTFYTTIEVNLPIKLEILRITEFKIQLIGKTY